MAKKKESLLQRSSRIQFLLLDVDGVLTDGSITYTERGDEIKAFHVRDGSGLKLWTKAGKRAGILSGRRSDLVLRRGLELGMSVILQGSSDKGASFQELLESQKVAAEEVCFVGDDIVDLPVLDRCGLAVAVADACVEAQKAAHFVTQHRGGRGAVREVVELLMGAQGLWDGLVNEVRGK